jgi:acyl-CoA synthetase (NDP forming)
MVQGIRGYPLLAGTRGRAPKDIRALVDIMKRLAKLVGDHPEIDQIDLNPVMVYEKGVSVVDYRIILK